MSRYKFLIFTALFFLVVFVVRPPLGTAYLSVGYRPEKTCFSVQYRGDTSSYRVTPIFVLPGEKVSLLIGDTNPEDSFVFEGPGNVWTPSSRLAWTWTAPRKTGLYPITITEARSGETMSLQVFVMVPYKAELGVINGYKIGRYPKIPAQKAGSYSLPRGFIEVTPKNKNALLTPHFKLGQFLCKQEGQYPKYIVLREKLLLKLEGVLEHVNNEGVPCRTFTVMSGYRTPHYNKILGNVKYSRHMWGDAADIFVTADPNDNYMADLNTDGKRDHRDAEILYRMVDELQDKPAFKDYLGGTGWYRSTHAHGPFVHVDARGTRAKWNSGS